MVSPSSATSTATATLLDSPRRFKIYFQDDEVCRRSQETVQQLILAAMDDSQSDSNSALLAKKALKYRKVFDRIAGLDVNAPEFDASRLLGVAWCKTACLKEHCERLQSGEKL